MIKKLIEKLSNPLLFYVDKSGGSVFKNFCLLHNTGNFYQTRIPKQNVGKALEYRFGLDKFLRRFEIFTLLVLYLIFIHINFSLFKLLFFEVLWILIVAGARLFCLNLYNEFLISQFGKYELVDFNPPIPKEKKNEYVSLYYSKIVALLLVVALFFAPSFLLKWQIKYNLISKKSNYKNALKLSNRYFMFYPKVQKVYDMRAFAKYMIRDYEGALEDYKTVLNLSGKRFTDRDYTRFENLLYLQKKVTSAQDAVDVFNEYVTKKSLSVMEEAKMLWIKSIFKIENNIPEGIVQDYDDLVSSLDEKDAQKRFYITCDKAYMLYLMREYYEAITIYNAVITYAQKNNAKYEMELKSLYAERGFAKKQLNDTQGAEADFARSNINFEDLSNYEPSYFAQKFVVDKF